MENIVRDFYRLFTYRIKNNFVLKQNSLYFLKMVLNESIETLIDKLNVG